MPPRYRPKFWHVLVVALIAVFDVIVLYMVLNPRVAQDYYNYFIDRSWSCFPRIISAYYPLGEPVSFVPGRSGYNRDTIRWCGFQTPNATGIRSFGDYGILKLKFEMPDEDLLLTFSSWANTNTGQPERNVQVVVNDVQLGTLSFTTAARVNGKIVIPQAVAKASGPMGMEIKFVVPRTGPPGTNREPQTLQLRLEALRVVPVSKAPPPADTPVGLDGFTLPDVPLASGWAPLLSFTR